jgi:hypothetical protein
MAHNPVNHPLRPLYRALGALAGVWLVLFGFVGVILNAGDDFFATTGERVLGQGANMFAALISLATGAVILIATAIGRNVDTQAYKFLGWGVLVVGSYGLATARIDANFLGFTIATVVVDYIVGLALVLASLYITSGSPEQSRAEAEAAHASR